jgi:hypothetical protein
MSEPIDRVPEKTFLHDSNLLTDQPWDNFVCGQRVVSIVRALKLIGKKEMADEMSKTHAELSLQMLTAIKTLKPYLEGK